MSNQELAIAEEEVIATDESSSSAGAEIATTATINEPAQEDEKVESLAETDEADSADDSLSIHDLQIGQRLVGTVKNIANFGAFVDVGIPQDGLVHISKLAKHKVEKVSDVVSQGQEVEVWVKKVDTQRGRLSLTMIKPVLRRLKDVEEGAEFEGTITRLESYGAFVDIDSDRDGLVHISQITHEYIKHPEEALTVGDKVKVKVLNVNRKKRQIDLSIKALLPLPVKEFEAEKPKEVEAPLSRQPLPESGADEGKFEEALGEESPQLTAMAVAYAAALQDKEDDQDMDKTSAKEKRQRNIDMDDIVARTLAGRKE